MANGTPEMNFYHQPVQMVRGNELPESISHSGNEVESIIYPSKNIEGNAFIASVSLDRDWKDAAYRPSRKVALFTPFGVDEIPEGEAKYKNLFSINLLANSEIKIPSETLIANMYWDDCEHIASAMLSSTGDLPNQSEYTTFRGLWMVRGLGDRAYPSLYVAHTTHPDGIAQNIMDKVLFDFEIPNLGGAIN
jgi:hypothetical protein